MKQFLIRFNRSCTFYIDDHTRKMKINSNQSIFADIQHEIVTAFGPHGIIFTMKFELIRDVLFEYHRAVVPFC